MADILELSNLKMYQKLEKGIEARISAYNHGPELAGIIRNTVKEALKEFSTTGYCTSLTLSESCSLEDVAAFKRVIKQIDHAERQVAAGVEEIIVLCDLLFAEGFALDR